MPSEFDGSGGRKRLMVTECWVRTDGGGGVVRGAVGAGGGVRGRHGLGALQHHHLHAPAADRLRARHLRDQLLITVPTWSIYQWTKTHTNSRFASVVLPLGDEEERVAGGEGGARRQRARRGRVRARTAHGGLQRVAARHAAPLLALREPRRPLLQHVLVPCQRTTCSTPKPL